MARGITNKIYRTFVKGLITEASPLTYPENASINEDNCIIFKKGNRSRRLGIEYENSHSLSSYTAPLSSMSELAIQDYVWISPNNDSNISIIVNQVGLNIYFYKVVINTLVNDSTISDGLIDSIDLTPYITGSTTADDAEKISVDFIHGKGYLFIVGKCFEPLFCEYSAAGNTVAESQIYINIRDFLGLADNLANDEEPTTLSKEHKYNLYNQGWLPPSNDGGGSSVTYYNQGAYFPAGTDTYTLATSGGADDPITAYHTSTSRYPGNNKQWWVAKDASSNFDPAILKKTYFGSNRAPRGRFVVNAFNIDRTAVSGVASITAITTDERPISVAFFSGRTWYLTDHTVYFSQIITDKSKIGVCFQEADPTSEYISDLVATDGGVIEIPEMHGAKKLLAIGAGVLCFATNGVWYITGTSAGFSALDISVSKINSSGVLGSNSIVEVDGQIFWWSVYGIQGMSPSSGIFGPIEGKFDKTNISIDTIQAFYNQDIKELAKDKVKGVYDSSCNTVRWLYPSVTSPYYRYNYDKILNLNLNLNAFYPWTISSTVLKTPHIVGAIAFPKTLNSERDSFIKYFVAVPVGSNFKFTYGEMNSTHFADWYSFSGVGESYESFVETGYELLEDAERKKMLPYIFCYFKRTEDEYIPYVDDYTLQNKSSCKLVVRWDWSSSAISNKWSQEQEVYRFVRRPAFDVSDLTFDTGYPIVFTKNKVRGTGKAIQFRFSNSEIDKDFDLLGWAVEYTGNTVP